jgi:hypothetical protein
MTTVQPPAGQERIPFAGQLTRKEFFLIQRMLLPWWGTMWATSGWFMAAALVYALVDNAGLFRFEAPQHWYFAPATWAIVLVVGFLFSPMTWVATALVVWVWILTTFVKHRQWWRMKREPQVITGSIGADNLQWHTAMTTSTYPWASIVKVKHAPGMLLLFYNARCAFYLPAQFFATEAAWHEAHTLALRYCPAKPS